MKHTTYVFIIWCKPGISKYPMKKIQFDVSANELTKNENLSKYEIFFHKFHKMPECRSAFSESPFLMAFFISDKATRSGGPR